MANNSLADLAGNAGDPSRLNPAMRRMLNANAESSRRNPGNSLWIERRKARGPTFPFWLKQGQRRKVLILSQPETFIVHKVNTDWISKNGNNFPDTEYAVCSKWALPEDPNASEWVKVGECGCCAALGEPKAITVMIICEFYPEPIEIKGKQVTQQVRLLIADSFGPQNQLVDAAMTDTANGDLRFCFMMISRSKNQQSPRVGDSYTVLNKAQKDAIAKHKGIVEDVKKINLQKAYSVLTPEEQIQVLHRHKMICDRHLESSGYEPEAMANALQGNFIVSGESPSKKRESGGTLADLADVETGTAEPLVDGEDFDIGSLDEDSTPEKVEVVATDPADSDDLPDIWN